MFLDITERKKSEEIVRKSEERYRELANFLQEIVFETDMNGQLVFANERAAEISGYSLSEIEKGLNILQFIAPEDRERGTKIIQRLLAGGGCVPGEYTFVRKDGTTFPALITATSRISENKVTGLRGLVIDITARKKTEEAIRLSEEKYRSLFENASDVILTGDLSGKITATNEAIKKYGFQKEQVVGRNVREFLSIEDGVRQDKIFQEVSSGKSFSGEIEALVVIGKRTFEVKTDPLRIGDRVVGFQTILRDVTERTKTEEALLASQQKFKALFSANPDAAVFLDTDFHVVEANSRFSVLFGYSVDEIKGKIITDIIVPDDAIEESRSIRQKIISGPVEIVALRKRKDASQVPLFMSGGPVVVNGKTIGSIMVYKDISDIITVQEELSNALAKAEVLNEKLSVVGGFTRHDVRNKLSTINGNLYLAEKYAGDNPLLHNCLGQIKTAVSNTVRILDFAKDYEMLGSHERVTLDVGKAVDDAASLFTDLKGVKIVNECRGYSVQADAMLSTIFHNLIDNSLKYGQNLTQIKVYIRSNQHKSESIIYEDDGVGVDTERKKQLFTRGFGVGTGFGLYLIRRTCEIYGWTVQETGDPGKGAQFVFSIPNKQRAE
jgi:PAS domain S-box-containing protein